MKATGFIAAALLLFTGIGAQAQEMENEPKGKAIVQIYTNFHSGFGVVNDNRGFELDRSYVGYEYSFGKGVSVKGVMDIGQSKNIDDYHHFAYIKNALVKWNTGRFTLQGGMIGMTQFNYQEKFWGYRYIYKSFQDQYKFGSSADLGISASWEIAKWIEADAVIANGEGYKLVQVDNGLLYGLGTTIKPFKGMSLRLYASLNEGVNGAKDIVNYAMFAGYKHQYFSLGVEYNIMRNNRRVAGQNLYGFSMYATGTINRWLDLYARADGLMSSDDWNKEKDDVAIIAGAQFKLGKYVKIAPNFRISIPSADDRENQYYGYISCCFGM
ncbi:MAG: hypothetical protein J6Q73_07095 [Bacteroidaceae bacterium]|nr:hypothetical protein [Bacteroidaceae bacterium]